VFRATVPKFSRGVGSMATLTPVPPVPTPARATACAKLDDVSTISNVPPYGAPAVGLNVTVITQLAPTASDEPQVDVCANTFPCGDRPLFSSYKVSPVITPSMDSGCVPEFVTVTDSGELAPIAVLGKLSVVVESVAGTGAAAEVPVPLNGTSCGALPASSVTFSVALNVAAELGVNVTEMLQLAAAASDAPHVLTGIAKADAPAPVIVGEMFVKAVLPIFASVTITAPLVLLTG